MSSFSITDDQMRALVRSATDNILECGSRFSEPHRLRQKECYKDCVGCPFHKSRAPTAASEIRSISIHHWSRGACHSPIVRNASISSATQRRVTEEIADPDADLLCESRNSMSIAVPRHGAYMRICRVRLGRYHIFCLPLKQKPLYKTNRMIHVRAIAIFIPLQMLNLY